MTSALVVAVRNINTATAEDNEWIRATIPGLDEFAVRNRGRLPGLTCF